MMTIPDPGAFLRWLFLIAVQIGTALLALAFMTWAGKMFMRALNF